MRYGRNLLGGSGCGARPRHGQLPDRLDPGKTAAHANGEYFLSGYASEVPLGFTRVPLAEILKVSDNIGNLRVPMMFDNAAYYLSHAEVQAAVAQPGHLIDVTRPMCDRCWDFMTMLGRYGGRGPVEVRNPSGLYVLSQST
jgi:hypothetical protein